MLTCSSAASRRDRRVATTLCGAALALFCANGYAEEIRINGGMCNGPVRLVAQNAPLSSVLKRLGESLGVELVYQSQRDPLITREIRSSPVDLVRDLAQGMNFTVEQIADGRCTGTARVAKVSVLPDRGGEASVPTTARQDFRTPEAERIARQTTLDYLRSHGMADETIESLAVK